MQCYTVYLSLEIAVHVSGGISINHQEHTQLYLQHLVLVKQLLLPAAIVEELELRSNSSTTAAGSSNGLRSTRCCRYSCVCSDDGWRYHPKHVEQFPDTHKLCNFASCWIYCVIQKDGLNFVVYIS